MGKDVLICEICCKEPCVGKQVILFSFVNICSTCHKILAAFFNKKFIATAQGIVRLDKFKDM